MKKVYLTLAAIIRDQEHYVKEWLTFQKLVGFERFLIALHRCSDQTESAIRSLPFSDDIILRRYESGDYIQMSVYSEWMRDFRNTTFWMAFFDGDEYLYGVNADDLKPVLTGFESCGSVLVHNHEFGASNHVLRPSGLSIDAFTWRASNHHWMHRNIKSFIRADSWQWFLSPHLAKTSREWVREDHNVIHESDLSFKCSVSSQPPISNIIRYNHYHTRSMEDWIQRYLIYSGPKNTKFDVAGFRHHDHHTVEDFTIQKFSTKLSEQLKE
ncbi:MAG: glycosyltransferase family 2 protein [Planctomycetaceae bacterium]|jgi:hypothetical protein|nr:glycosyltransferase family 2 protein [Planctomycetaceae bacterium]